MLRGRVLRSHCGLSKLAGGSLEMSPIFSLANREG
jgi:hypothetical protein